MTFGAIVSSEEYYFNGSNYVNGYHVFRDGKFYICLPDKVSIPGKEQVSISVYNNTTGEKKADIPVTSVQRLDDTSCEVNGVTAYWWCMEAKNIDASTSNNGSRNIADSPRVTVQLATDAHMQSVNWDFRNGAIIQVDGQAISWGAANSYGTNCNITSALRKSSSSAQIQKLAEYFEKNSLKTNLGMEIYNSTSGVVKLNIVRAEAKLEVETSLHKENETDNVSSITLGSADDRLEYDVTISSNDGGAASDFSYYIPIASTDSKLDPQALAVEKEFNLKLLNAVEVKKIRQGTTNTDIPFKVYYTKAGNLDSETIRGDAVTWYTDDQLSDHSGITAVKIVTTENAQVDTGDAYRFRIAVGYDNAANAGKRDSWRSFGRYTYVRNGSTTTNSYPNEGVSVIVSYTEDKTTDQGARIHVVLDTAAAANRVEKQQDLFWTPLKSQVLKIKKAVVSSGTSLVTADPSVVFTYAVNDSEGNDSFSEHRSLALVLTAKGADELPKDASLNIEEGETRDSFNQIKKGVFVIPLGTIQSGNKTIIMRSDLFPEEEKDYSFTAQLYLSDSSESASPLNGRKAGSSVDVVFKKADAKRPALKISGMRVADLADWAEGCPVNIQVQNIPEQGIMTVTLYYGLAGSDKATALLSSVSGVFTIGNGTGTYDSSKTPTGQLILSSSAQKGTYRLLFEIKDASQTTVLTVPYYVIVR